jgi:hypothetical protein
MRISELATALSTHPDHTIRFQLPNGELTPAHAHVTEVARISKRFIDCGGTLREESLCRLQTWVADDYQHRLTAGKLAKILEKGRSILGADDLEVDIEHDLGFVTQLPLRAAESKGSELVLVLTGKNTACLAPELCCPTPPQPAIVGLGRKRE